MTLNDIVRVASKLGAYEQSLQITGTADCELAIVVDREDLERIKDEVQRYSQWHRYDEPQLRVDEVRVCGILVLPRPRT